MNSSHFHTSLINFHWSFCIIYLFITLTIKAFSIKSLQNKNRFRTKLQCKWLSRHLISYFIPNTWKLVEFFFALFIFFKVIIEIHVWKERAWSNAKWSKQYLYSHFSYHPTRWYKDQYLRLLTFFLIPDDGCCIGAEMSDYIYWTLASVTIQNTTHASTQFTEMSPSQTLSLIYDDWRKVLFT